MLKHNKIKQRTHTPLHLRYNLRPSLVVLLIPIIIGALTISLIASGLYYRNLASFGSNRLITNNWQSARSIMLKQQPTYNRQYAYYQVKDGQTIDSIAEYFSVTSTELSALNPGIIVTGTTIKIPPIMQHYTPATSNGLISNAVVTDDHGMLRIVNKYGEQPPIVTNLVEISQLLEPYNAIVAITPKTYRINRPISIEGNIRVDITKDTVSKIELLSTPKQVTCLCFDHSSTLIDGVSIISYDSETAKPDLTTKDGRSFVRMKNGRMDVLNSKLSFLGNGLDSLPEDSPLFNTQKDGGVYGVSWRIAGDKYGQEITTGWVEHNQFDRNYFGSYSFGASGMVWRGNTFSNNNVYGLDPHDDSNNAIIEDNIFKYNGKHGFIMSKRCNYNIIRHNLSVGNKLNGFMLHENSAYNLVEHNISSHNYDNYVIYASNFNTIRNNKSYDPIASHVRINRGAKNSFITGNKMYGGKRGVYLYDQAANTYIADNHIQNVDKKLQTQAAQNTLFANNTVDDIRYDIAAGDRMIFGPNNVKKITFTTGNNDSLLNDFRQ